MLKVMIGLLALLGGSPEFLVREDFGHGWEPTKVQVDWFDQQLAVPARMDGPKSNFDRYYTGVFRGGHRVLVVHLVKTTYRLQGVAGVARFYIVKPEGVPQWADGGCDFVRLSYDEDTQTASDLVCNHDIGPPLPPPAAPK